MALAIRIELSPETHEALMRPVAGSGGFQSLLRTLQAKTTGRVLTLALEDVERVSRYVQDYGDGGFQGRLDGMLIELDRFAAVLRRMPKLGDRRRAKPIALSDLQQARAEILENTHELLQDTLLLLNERRYARAYALAVLAREELAKLAMVVRAVYAIRAEETFNWDRLQKRMRNHEEKLTLAALIEIVLGTNVAGSADPKGELLRLLDDPANRQQLNTGKQDGFYVSVGPAGVRSPLSVISEQDARNLHEQTRVIFEFFSTSERSDSTRTSFVGIDDLYGKIVCLAEDLIEEPDAVSLPR